MKRFQCVPLAAAMALALALAQGAALAQGGTPAGTGATSGAAPTAPAAQPGTGTRNSPSADTAKLARGDRKFIVDVAEGGMFEVEASKLAAGKATNPEVKSFASMLVEDHTKANSELTQLANAKGVELPVAPPHGKRKDLEKLGKLTGDKFDREFAREVGLKDHRKDIKLFEKHSKDAKDPELKAWIDKTLPTLRAHLAAAEKLPPNAKGKS